MLRGIYTRTEEIKGKQSERMKGRKLSEEHKRKIKESRLGKPHPHKAHKISDEVKIKLSKVLKGKPKPWLRGKNNPQWKGGRHKDIWGYIWVLVPSHPYAMKDGYIREHRLVMEKIIGRYLLPNEIPHHINGIKDDNRPENLELFNNQSQHIKNVHSQKHT